MDVIAAERDNINVMDKPILYFDMDNVLVDFKSALDKISEDIKIKYADDGTGRPHLDDIPGLFSLMDPMPGAVDAVKTLKEKYDMFILSTAPWNNPSAWSDKLRWVQKYFGDIFHKRLILTHNKHLCIQPGAYLIDDRPRNGASKFGEHWIRFGSDRFPDWQTIVDYLMNTDK